MFAAMVLLMAAIGIEVVSTTLLPKADGFTDPLWSGAVLVGYGVSIWLLTLVVRTVPVSVAYAIWAGVGTALVAVAGYAFLGEPLGWLKVLFLALIVAGVLGLNLTGSH